MTAYCSNVPWESVSKIVKKKSCDKVINCLRLEDEFWTSAFQYVTGGTCYESNWAFFCFLQNLGFDGYLTSNKIIDKSSVHSAIVIMISDKDMAWGVESSLLYILLVKQVCSDI